MTDNPEAAALLGGSERPASTQSRNSDESHENTPLLSRTDSAPRYNSTEDEDEDERRRIPSPAATSLRSIQNGQGSSTKPTKGDRRWPTFIAVGVLGLVMLSIIAGGFFAPAAIEEYAKQSLVVEPTKLSIHNFTSTGVTARVQAVFRMDASRVKNNAVRNIGRFGTWVAREVETNPSTIQVYLPEYGNVLIGTAAVPRIAVDIRNGHNNAINFLTALEPGDMEDIRRVANDWLEGRLDKVRITGKASVDLKSGLLSLGSQEFSESLTFEGNDIPSIPKYNITRMNFREVPVSPPAHRGMAADVSLTVSNSYPIRLTIPPLSFDILVPNCGTDEPHIRLADATTDIINIEPYSDVIVGVGGIVQEIPKSLLQTCPNSHSSPLDLLLGDYIHGNATTIYVRGSSMPSPDTPEWIAAIMASVTVPVPFPGRTFNNLIKNFSLTDAHFSLPSPLADPEDSNPKISGNIVVIAAVPKEMNFDLKVTRVRATANVFYKEQQLGVLNLKKWQPAESQRLESKEGGNAALKVQSKIENAPLDITDEDVFTDVLQDYLFGGKAVMLKIAALVDAEISTVLGKLVIKDMPAEGVVPVKPISKGGDIADLKPKVSGLRVLSTSTTSLNLQARINFTNPTEYTAHIPYFNIHILNNGSIIGDATVRNVNLTLGNNTDVLVEATWDPTSFGGNKAAKIGRELLSQYISGFNTTLTFQTHENSIPHQPELGKALSKFAITLPSPRLSTPGPGGEHDDDDDGKPHFIEDATFHLFSSSAQFILFSPMQYSTIYIETIDATAFYNHTEPVGRIIYDLPFKVPPGSSQTPKLPVDWSFGSVGYEAVKNALGGTLKLDANGTFGVRLGQWSETVWYIGSGIGATVTL